MRCEVTTEILNIIWPVLIFQAVKTDGTFLRRIKHICTALIAMATPASCALLCYTLLPGGVWRGLDT
jgi:hypothetical protein